MATLGEDNHDDLDQREIADSGNLGASPGRMVTAPSTDIGEPATQQVGKADARAGQQLLTSKAARAGALLPTSLSPAGLAWRKLKKNKIAVAGMVILIILYASALIAQFIAPYGYASQQQAAFQPPVSIHWTPAPTIYPTKQTFDIYHDRIYTEDFTKPQRVHFFVKGEPYKLFGFIPTRRHLFGTSGDVRCYLLGTDQFGRDYFSRMLYASQISLSVGLIGILITFSLGMLIGGASGYYGGIADDIIMRLCEIIMSVPDFYLLLALAATLPPTLSPIVVYVLIIGILSLVGWAGMARVIRGMVLSVREREYVEAARALGVSDFKIIVRHVIPSTFTYAIVSATMAIPGFILGEAGLSFLGLGIRDPMPSWGNMLSAAQDLTTLEQRPWLLVPGFMIFVTTLAFNFMGDGLRDALDPKSK